MYVVSLFIHERIITKQNGVTQQSFVDHKA